LFIAAAGQNLTRGQYEVMNFPQRTFPGSFITRLQHNIAIFV